MLVLGLALRTINVGLGLGTQGIGLRTYGLGLVIKALALTLRPRPGQTKCYWFIMVVVVEK